MIQSFPTPEALADAVARHVVSIAVDALSTGGRFTLALSGGSTPRAAYERLATDELAHQLDWQRTHVLWGDERCVPPDNPKSNYRMAKEALLDRVPIPPNQVYRIRGEDEPQEAAADYEDELRSLNGSLDLVLLGLGEDGHTASLFPGQPTVHETEYWVMAVPAPTGDMWRITLTPAVLNLAGNVTFVVSGASKAQRLAEVLQGPFNPDLLPAQAIRPLQGRLTWMVDEAAAAQLRPAPA
ncbi:MAG TPA: 6-phosphogluconolactonase [Gemmatimonadales bacterium]|nr:6-phosphogluconolactonase [Gemmatimonadales bacterium]